MEIKTIFNMNDVYYKQDDGKIREFTVSKIEFEIGSRYETYRERERYSKLNITFLNATTESIIKYEEKKALEIMHSDRNELKYLMLRELMES